MNGIIGYCGLVSKSEIGYINIIYQQCGYFYCDDSQEKKNFWSFTS